MYMKEKVLHYFSDQMHFKRQSTLFKKLLYLLVLIKSMFWLSHYALYFGENSIVYTKPFINLGIIQNAAFILHQMNSDHAGYFFIVPVFLIALAGLFEFRIIILTDLLLWFLVVNIHNRIYSTLTGGEVLMNQLLFFNAFIAFASKKPSSFSTYQNILHNFGSFGVILEVCFVYFFSALAKLQNESWVSGNAIIETLQVAHYSTPFLSKAVITLPWLFVALNYVVLAYQLFFPVLVWIKRIKRPFIIIGILMHLFIVFGMGLVTFGSVMILTYIYFWPLQEESRI